MRTNAKRRDKKFELTFDQFKEFAIKTNYIAGKGRSATSYHIDRIDEELGYTINNIQVLTNIENSKKYRAYLNVSYDETGKPYKYWVKTIEPYNSEELDEDCTF